MRVLVVTHFSILDPDRPAEGNHARLRMFMNAIGRMSTNIDYIAISSVEDMAAHPDSERLSATQTAYWGTPVSIRLVPIYQRPKTFWSHYGAGVLAAAEQPHFYRYAGPEQVRIVKEYMNRQPDLVFVKGLASMNAVCRTRLRPERLFFDLDDIEHRVRVRSALQPPFRPGSLGYIAQAPALWAAERRATLISRATFVCSELDRAYLRRVGITSRIKVIPNALPVPLKVHGLTTELSLLFLGGYSYQPNRDAAHRLATSIWPIVREAMPTSRLIIAGHGPEHIPCFHTRPLGVEFTGYVPDLDDLYARSRVVVCPMLVGGGTRIKLIEAALQGKPIVSTRVGAEGLDLREGREILLRDDDASFAAACVGLLRDNALAQTLGSAARHRATLLYDARQIENNIRTVMSERNPSPG